MGNIILRWLGDMAWHWQTFWINAGWFIGQGWDAIGGWTGFLQIVGLAAIITIFVAACVQGYRDWRNDAKKQPAEPITQPLEALKPVRPEHDEAFEDYFWAMRMEANFSRDEAQSLYYDLPQKAEWGDAERSGTWTIKPSELFPWLKAEQEQEEKGEQA